MRHQGIRTIALATAVVLCTATVAIADGLQADGDGDFVAFGASMVEFGDVCRDHSYTKPVEVAVRRAGNVTNATQAATIFGDGETVTFGFAPFAPSTISTDSGNGAQVVNGAGVTLSAHYRATTPTVVLPAGTNGWGSKATGTFSDHVQADTTLDVPADAPLGDPNTADSNGTTRWNVSGKNRAGVSFTLNGFQRNEWTVIAPSAVECNRAPAIVSAAFTAAHAACAGATLAIELADADLDVGQSGENLDLSIVWGDGTTTTEDDLTDTSRSVSHTYAHAGRYTAEITVADQHGETATAQADVSVDLATAGIEQPVNADGSSIFKAGSTVPVKVRFVDCDGSVPNGLDPTISVAKVSGAAPTSGVEEPSSTSAADTGTTMRFSEGQWIYNLATRSLSDPTARYRLVITVAETGQTVTAGFGLR
jgi:hypothetical protein